VNARCSPQRELRSSAEWLLIVQLPQFAANAAGPFFAVKRLSQRAKFLIRLFILLNGCSIASTLLPGETLKIATYNVENYVAANRMTEAGYRQDYPKPEVQKSALRSVIRRINADVLVLQEMGAETYLDELRRDLKFDGLEYAHAVLLKGPDQDRHVAVLSKREFVSVTSYANLEFSYLGGKEKVKRGLLEVSVASSVGPITFFGVHLKSRFTDREDDFQSTLRRQGEASAIRDQVLARFPDPAPARFLILGDFNDDKASKTMQRFERRGPVSIAQLLPAVDSRGERWTHAYKKADSYTRVDHVLVSAELIPAVRDGAGHIEDGSSVLEASDHRPVVVVFDFPDKK
jgi:endonuclease/exonuclease/phosphatase family metal-dependent hydrolase